MTKGLSSKRTIHGGMQEVHERYSISFLSRNDILLLASALLPLIMQLFTKGCLLLGYFSLETNRKSFMYLYDLLSIRCNSYHTCISMEIFMVFITMSAKCAMYTYWPRLITRNVPNSIAKYTVYGGHSQAVVGQCIKRVDEPQRNSFAVICVVVLGY